MTRLSIQEKYRIATQLSQPDRPLQVIIDRYPRREVEVAVRAQLLHTTAMYNVLEFIARLARATCLH